MARKIPDSDRLDQSSGTVEQQGLQSPSQGNATPIRQRRLSSEHRSTQTGQGCESPRGTEPSPTACGRQRTSSGEALGAIPRPTNLRSTPPPSLSPSPRELRTRRRRLDSLNLDPPRQTGVQTDDDHCFHFGRFLPSFSSRPTSQDTVLEGQELYLHFFHERLRNEGLGDLAFREEERLDVCHEDESHFWFPGGNDDSGDGRRTFSFSLANLQNPVWRQTGHDLKLLADEFARSVERARVMRRAERVDISTLTMEKFMSMLSELFQGGRITKERILVLFFFCSDVAIFAIRNGATDLLSQLTQWTLMFIKDKVCSWVQNNGGWANVLRSGMNFVQQSVFLVSCAMVITCCAIYIRKNFSS